MTQTDSKGRVLRQAKDDGKSGGQNFKWWLCKKSEMANSAAGRIKYISDHQGSRLEQLTVDTRLYSTNTAFSILGTAFTRSSSVATNPMSDRISYNLVASVIDTLVAKMSENKVIPTFITNGGDWEVQKRAEDLTKFAQGWAYGVDLHTQMMRQWLHACVWGDGYQEVFEKNGKAVIESVLPHELFADMVESMVTPPQCMDRVKVIDRDIAMELWPASEAEIASIAPANYQEIGGEGTSADLVTITDSVHLRSGPDAEDGLRAFCIGNHVLDVIPWNKKYFPWVKLPYVERPIGWYGQGAAERLQKLQQEINRGMITIQKSHWLQAGPKIALSNTSKIVSQHISNELGVIIRHAEGQPPLYMTPPIIQAEVYQWVDSLIAKGYQQEGLNQMSASGEHPLGVDSGKALRTLADEQDARFKRMAQNVEKATLQVVAQAIDVVRDIYKDSKTYEVSFPSTQFLETIDWKDVNLEEDQYVLKAYPTSSLSDDLTGRLSDVQELAQAGMIDPDTAESLLDMPDVELHSSLKNGARDLLKKILGNILKTGKYGPDEAPDPTMNLQLAGTLVLQYINYGRSRNAPLKNIQMLEAWNDQLKDLIQQATPPPAPQMPQGAPANPEPTPTSNLIPNVNEGVQ